jgi:hypothetical protein
LCNDSKVNQKDIRNGSQVLHQTWSTFYST